MSISHYYWSFLIQVLIQLINLVVSIVLARILLPKDFGLIAMISIFIAIGNVLSNSGLGDALIRSKKKITNEIYNSVFGLNLIISFFLFFILFYSSTYISAFFSEPDLIKIIKVLSLVIIFNSISIVQAVKLRKKLLFKKQFIIQIPALIISASIGLTLAYKGFGVWSLVYKELIFAISHAFFLFLGVRWVPSFKYDFTELRNLLSFGLKLSMANLIISVSKNLNNIFIGKYFSTIELGFFNRADSLQKLPNLFFINTLNRVAYPVLSNERKMEILLSKFKRYLSTLIFLLFPVICLLHFEANKLIPFLITEKWNPIVPFFKLLLIAGFFDIIIDFSFNILKVNGNSSLILKITSCKTILTILGILLSLNYGVIGIVYSLLFINLFFLFLTLFQISRDASFFSKSLIIEILKIIFVNLISYASLFFVENLFSFNSYIIEFSTSCLMFMSINIILSHLFKINSLIFAQNQIFKSF